MRTWKTRMVYVTGVCLLIPLIALHGCAENREEGESDAQGELDVIEGPASWPTCATLSDCPAPSFSCVDGVCDLGIVGNCPSIGLGAPCEYLSPLTGETNQGRCGLTETLGYHCAPTCDTAEECGTAGTVCQTTTATGQEEKGSVCAPRCESDYECMGGTWQCNPDGTCEVPSQSICDEAMPLSSCTFTGTSGVEHTGVCSVPPATIDGPPFYAVKNLCVPLCDADNPADTCDHFTSVCQRAEVQGMGSAPDGKDIAVCVAVVCDGPEDCMGGWFGCVNGRCILPSLLPCEGKDLGEDCTREADGESWTGICNGFSVCVPKCEGAVSPDAIPEEGNQGTCETHPDSTVCISTTDSSGQAAGLCANPMSAF